VIAADNITKQEVYAAPLEGTTFEQDNNTVWNILRSFTIGTPAWERIRQLDGSSNGRQGMIRLCSHYDGPDKRRARINEAKAIIEKLHYKGEGYMIFEKFVAKLTVA
jgi:hypothetical protein